MFGISKRPFCVKGGEIIGNVPTIEELAFHIKEYILNDGFGLEWGSDNVKGATRKALYDMYQTVVGQLEYKGLWDASVGSYPEAPELGWYYVASVAGEVGGIWYEVGDWIIWNGTSWDKLVGLVLKVIEGANSEDNAVKIGDGMSKLDVYAGDGHVKVYQEDATGGTEKGRFGSREVVSVIRRPSADGITVLWDNTGGGADYLDVDDPVEEPEGGDADRIYTNVDNCIEEFDLPSVEGFVRNYTVWVRTDLNGAGHTKNLSIYIDYNDEGGWISIGSVVVDADEGAVYHFIVVGDANKDGMGWKIKLVSSALLGSEMSVYVLYLNVDYSVLKPFQDVYARNVFDDDGSLVSYSVVDDLQLLRDMKEWSVREKIVNNNFPRFKQAVWDKETIPWIVSHPNVGVISKIPNFKRYQSTLGQKIGYILSVMKKMLEVVDELETRVKALGG